MKKNNYPIPQARTEISWAVKGIFISETDKAVCIEIEARTKWGSGDKKVWLPKSCIRKFEGGYTIPTWLYNKLRGEVPDGYWAIHAPDCICAGCAPKGTFVWLRCGLKPYVVTRQAFDEYNQNNPKPLRDDNIRRLSSINS